MRDPLAFWVGLTLFSFSAVALVVGTWVTIRRSRRG